FSISKLPSLSNFYLLSLHVSLPILRVAHRPNDANIGLPRRIVPIANALAQGVLMGPILAGKIFIDNGHRLDALGQRIRNGNNATDRKSTRLNSSHVAISYAVFCLKK